MAEHGLSSAVKLASNESPFGPLPGVAEAVAAATARSGRYPDHLAGTLRDVLADRHRVEPERVTVGCGSVGLLQQLALAYAGPGDEVLFPWPSFIAYPQFTLLSGASVTEAPLRHWVADVEALLAAATARTTMVLIANPNNPTSTALRTVDLLHLVDALPPSVLVVVDEAYREYVTDADVPDALELFRGRAQRGGACGRSRRRGRWPASGWATSSATPWSSNAADATLTPFSVSGPAQSAALAALEQDEEVRRRAGLVVAERTRVRRPWPPAPGPSPTAKATSSGCRPDRRSGDLATAMEREGVVTTAVPDRHPRHHRPGPRQRPLPGRAGRRAARGA